MHSLCQHNTILVSYIHTQTHTTNKITFYKKKYVANRVSFGGTLVEGLVLKHGMHETLLLTVLQMRVNKINILCMRVKDCVERKQ